MTPGELSMTKLLANSISWLKQQLSQAKSTNIQEETELNSQAIVVVHKTAKKSYPPPPLEPPFDLGIFIKQEIQKRWQWIKTHYYISATITNQDIVNLLAEQGITVDRRPVIIEEPIKALGVYTIPSKIEKDVTADCKVWVVKKS